MKKTMPTPPLFLQKSGRETSFFFFTWPNEGCSQHCILE